MGPVATVQGALTLLKEELPSNALLDVNLGNELVTPVAADLRAHNVPFAIASACDRPEEFGGEVLSGAPNVGKPTRDASPGRFVATDKCLAEVVRSPRRGAVRQNAQAWNLQGPASG
jgi:hypothetical protein